MLTPIEELIKHAKQVQTREAIDSMKKRVERRYNDYLDPCPRCSRQLKYISGGGVKCLCGY